MGWGTGNLGGGSGGGLNFKVVGNPQPSTAKENTIWVNTDEDITEWVFAPENPYLHKEDIYTSDGIKSGYYLNSSGAETSSSNFNLTKAIALPDNTFSVTISAGSMSTTSVYHGWYDESGTLISTFLRKTGTATYDVPSGAKSIRVSLRADDTESLIANYYVVDNGAVWFSTGLSSPREFNALKKNCICIYPIYAKQWINGSWVRVTAMSYQSGEWREWITYLYNKGDQCTDITGGWKGQIKENYTGVAPGYTFNADNIRIYKGTTSEGKMGVLATVNKIDLTNVNIVTFKITVNTTIGGAVCYVGNKNNNNEGAAAQTEVGKTTGLTECSIDVSALTGSYYVGLRTYAAKSDTIDYTVHEVYYA